MPKKVRGYLVDICAPISHHFPQSRQQLQAGAGELPWADLFKTMKWDSVWPRTMLPASPPQCLPRAGRLAPTTASHPCLLGDAVTACRSRAPLPAASPPHLCSSQQADPCESPALFAYCPPPTHPPGPGTPGGHLTPTAWPVPSSASGPKRVCRCQLNE